MTRTGEGLRLESAVFLLESLLSLLEPEPEGAPRRQGLKPKHGSR